MRFIDASMPAVKNALCATALAFGLSAASLLAAPALAAAAAPELTIAAPAGFTDNPSPTFKGTTTDEADGVTVRVFVGSSTGGAPAETVTPGLADPAAGAWTDEGGFLADGQYTAFAEQTHEGERGESPPVTFTIDTTHPEVSMSTVASFTSNTTPTLLGNAGAAPGDKSSVTVRLFAGSSTGGVLVNEQVVSAPGGAWSYGAPTLAQGTYTAQAAQDDEAGNEGLSAPQTFTVDTTGPAVAVNLLSSPTNNSKPSITGHLGAAPGDVSTVSVVVYQGAITGGTTAAEGTATNTGETSWSFSPHLEDGQYTVQAIQSDKAGNITKSNEVTFTIDTKPPLVAVKAPSGFVKSTTPTIEGTGGTAPGDLSPVTVRIFKGSGTSGSPVSTSSPTLSSGSWSFVSPTSLTEGTYTIQAVQRDEAGNEGSSSPMQFTVDMKKPVVTISAPKRNEIVHVSQPTFAGAAGEQPGDIRKVKLQINEVTETGKEVKVQELTLQSTSTWSTDTTTGPHFPPEGHYVAIVEQSDEAGNTETVKVPFSVEARSPNVTLAKSGLAEREPERLYAGATPTFSGGAQAGEKDSATVYLRIFEGSSSTGHEVEEVEGKRSGTSWVIGPIPALADGTYTAQAEQTALGEENGFSTPATFTVDADAPHPAILAPVNGTALASTTIGLTGAAGTSPGDDGAVTAEVFPGSAATGAPTETITVPANGGSWSAPLGTLPAGTYTALALQSDDVGNSGASAPVTFSLSEPAPPTASFTWFPTAPHVGESISLVSTSIDPTSAIVGYGWSLAGTGVYTPGGQTIGTSFTTPGNHVVQLLVTDQNGASSSISETILVTTTPVSLMQPFPVVRIAGSEGSAGVKIKLLSVQAPIGAKVSIACKGKGCPAKLVSALAAASKGKHPPGSALIVFKRFQRLLPPGVTLEIKVSKAGEIGKFTRFVSRKHKLPTRSDSCLSLLGKPMACPST